MLNRAVIILIVFGVIGCGQQAHDTQKPAQSSSTISELGRIRAIRILPENPSRDAMLEADVLFRGPSTEQLSYQWLKNEAPIPGAVGSTLSGELFRKGDFISVRVQVTESGAGGDPVTSDSVLIGNALPVIQWIGIGPNPAPSTTDLEAEVQSSDPDNDQVSHSYEWKVNGETVVGQEDSSLASTHFSRGDQVEVAVTPFDGTDWGETASSIAIAIQNGPPNIVSTPPERLEEGGHYRYEVRADDKDGDPLRFSLQGEPPPGMKIDGKTGVVEWEVDVPDGPAAYQYEVVVEDPEGAKSVQQITLNYAP